MQAFVPMGPPVRCCSSAAFIGGGIVGYWIFRGTLTYLLVTSRGSYVTPMVLVTEYFNLFFNATIGVGLAFLLAVTVLLVTTARIASSSFLLFHRGLVGATLVLGMAIVTPTTDPFNLLLVSLLMYVSFHFGLIASYVLGRVPSADNVSGRGWLVTVFAVLLDCLIATLVSALVWAAILLRSLPLMFATWSCGAGVIVWAAVRPARIPEAGRRLAVVALSAIQAEHLTTPANIAVPLLK